MCGLRNSKHPLQSVARKMLSSAQWGVPGSDSHYCRFLVLLWAWIPFQWLPRCKERVLERKRNEMRNILLDLSKISANALQKLNLWRNTLDRYDPHYPVVHLQRSETLTWGNRKSLTRTASGVPFAATVLTVSRQQPSTSQCWLHALVAILLQCPRVVYSHHPRIPWRSFCEVL